MVLDKREPSWRSSQSVVGSDHSLGSPTNMRLRTITLTMTHGPTGRQQQRQRRRRRPRQLHVCASILALGAGLISPSSVAAASSPAAASASSSSSAAEVLIPPKPNGDPSCPCLSAQELEDSFSSGNRPDRIYHKGFDFNETLGDGIDALTYGVGCEPHDLDAAVCHSGACDTSTLPQAKCAENQAWCQRSFCYVDPDTCDLLHKPSLYYRHRYYSYATCGYMDFWTASKRVDSLRGDTLKVAFNSNTGGWKGASNPEGSFAINNQWKGPIVEFMNNVAFRGGFTINVTAPPMHLKAGSEQFFGGSSSFDFCVYAASLGYVDLCVAAYSITDRRAAATTFFETSDDPIYLVTFNEDSRTSWSSFTEAFGKLFSPFTLGAWIMIVLISLPILGLLMMYHEYGSPGSAYPRTAPYLETDPEGSTTDMIRNRKIPLVQHIGRSLYMAVLSFFQESYDQSVVTTGGKIHLLAISSLVYLVLAVYTANLAAILTSENLKSSIDSIDSAIAAGFNICSERKVMEMVLNRYDIDPSFIVPDPPSLGGDGQPGFTCPNCESRKRVFEMMRRTHNDKAMYCNAAFASVEDLEALNARGTHCDKVKVGEPIAHDSIGLPIYDGVSDGIAALLHDMKNDGLLNKEYGFYQPSSRCPESGGEGSSLTVAQLTGIWMISFSFAFAGLIAKFVTGCTNRRKEKQKGKRYRALYRNDQWGTPCDNVVIHGKRFDLSTHEFVKLNSHRHVHGTLSDEVYIDQQHYYDTTDLHLSIERGGSSDEISDDQEKLPSVTFSGVSSIQKGNRN